MTKVDFDVELQKFSEFLALPISFEKEALEVANRIFTVLQSQGNIDRCRIVGGFGKKTSTSVKADLDAVVFINMEIKAKTDSKLSGILEEWKRVLNNALENPQMETTSKTLKVKCGEISLDILPAVNMSKDPKNVEESQLKETLKYIQTEGKNNSTFANQLSAELAESSLTFLKGQTKFAHDFARLAKFWNQGLLYHEYVYGRSLIIETLAVHCANLEENNNVEPSMSNCLKRFFGELADIRKLFVWFDKNYSEDQIPSGTMTQRPLLLDPTNPYNNLLATGVEYTSDGVKPDLEFWTFLATCAGGALKTLNTSSIPLIFYPHFRYADVQTDVKVIFSNFLISEEHAQEDPPRSMPGHEIRKKGLNEGVLRSIFGCFAVIHRISDFVCPNMTTEPLVEIAEKFLGLRGQWTIAADLHINRDVTVYLPYISKEKMFVISFNVQKF